MTVEYHGVPGPMFAALAAGGGGADAVAELARAQYSKHLLLLRGTLTSGDATARAGYELLARVQRCDRAAAAAVIGHPSVGAWAQHVHRGNPAAATARLAAAGAAAAIRARMPAEIEVPVASGLVILPTLGAASVPGGSTSVMVRVLAGGGAEVADVTVPVNWHREIPGWQPMRPFRFGLREVLIDDLDPFRMPALGDAVAPRLTAADTDRLAASLRDAWHLLATRHPEAAAEVGAAVTTIVPHVTPSAGHSTSTTAETFGAVALSSPLDAATTAVSLVHEVQHLKLFALLDVVTLLQPDDGRLYYAPWRPDPRPLGGLLQGAYAFLGVSGFWRRQRHPGSVGAVGGRKADELAAHTEFARWLAATWQVIQTLQASGQLTPPGAEFVAGMAATAAVWQGDAVPDEARAAADAQAADHLARWEATGAATVGGRGDRATATGGG